MPDNATWEQFWDKVSREEDGCWIWQGPKHPRGYPSFCAGGIKGYAHRISWEWANGPIPEGFVIIRTCGDRSCVRPDHLERTTRGGSMGRAARNGAWEGIKNGNARRTEAEVSAIKILSWLGVPARLVSEALGIPERSVYAVIRGECWRHLEPRIDHLLEICEAIEKTIMRPNAGG